MHFKVGLQRVVRHREFRDLYQASRTLCTSNLRSRYVEATCVRYPSLKRGNYSFLTDQHIKFFESVLEPYQVITDENELERYNVDWMRSVRGLSKLVLRPKTIDQISSILNYCNKHKIAVCPQGGNTGLVGGSVPVFDEVVLSLSLMNTILAVDEITGIATVEAGIVLEKLESTLHQNNLTLPLDLGSKGSCQIGGNISTNAGGIRLLRYGSLHGSVLGLKAVLATGQILDCLNTNKKDNTGYDLKHLFIGSEGTLGIVTHASLQCPTKPTAVKVGLLGLNNFGNVLETMRLAKRGLAEILSSYEFIDRASMHCVESQLQLKCPIGDFPFYVLIETSGSNEGHDAEKLEQLFETLLNTDLVADGTIATDGAQFKNLWALRERISEALGCEGYVYKYDVSVPTTKFYELVEDMRKQVGSQAIRCCGYGHLGDGNLHLNITSEAYDFTLLKKIEPFVYEWVSREHGSVSAEHGLGFKKRGYIGFSKSESSIEWMYQVKKLFDPNNILNPYKVLPDTPDLLSSTGKAVM